MGDEVNQVRDVARQSVDAFIDNRHPQLIDYLNGVSTFILVVVRYKFESKPLLKLYGLVFFFGRKMICRLFKMPSTD